MSDAVGESGSQEARRVADAVHDELIPLLAVARQELLEEGPPGDVLASVDAALVVARQLIVGARPELTRARSIADVLRGVAGPACARGGLELVVQLDELYELPALRLDQPTRAVLLVAIGEIARNAARHAQARRLVISVSDAPDALRISFTDDGRGIDPGLVLDREREGHVGLPRLRAQVESVGARLRIESRPGRTMIELCFPAEHVDAAGALAALPLSAMGLPWGVLTVEDGRLLEASPELCDLLGRTRATMLEDTDRSWLLDASRAARCRERAAAFGSHQEAVRVRHGDATDRPAVLSLSRISGTSPPLLLALLAPLPPSEGQEDAGSL